MTTSLHLATWLAQRSLHVFPLRVGSKRPWGNCRACKTGKCLPSDCACLGADRPCHGLLAATTDPDAIRRW